MSDVADRHALVTGAAGGLGLAQCATLARAGAAVTMLDLPDREGALEAVRAAAPGAEMRWLGCDLSDPRAAQAAVRELADASPVGVLVNNAAINPVGPVEACDLDDYERVQAVNATAALALSQAVIPGMRAAGRGGIVMVASNTLSGGWSDFAAYVASKGTLLGLTRAMARELGPHGIRVNAISPGAIPTPLEREVWGAEIEVHEARILERQSLKVRGAAEDVAEALLFLASERSRFVTGQNLVVDGGYWMP